MHKIECVIEMIITAITLIACASVAVPALWDVPTPPSTKIELLSRPSHD